MSCRGLIAAVATVAAIVSGDAGAGLASAQSRQEPDLAAYDLGVAAAVRSDLAASVRLPDGGQVYVFGDTLAVNGQMICGPSHCPDGYPHDSIAIQRPGTATFGDAIVRRRRMPLRMAVGARLAGRQLLLDGRARRGRHQPVRHRGTHQPGQARSKASTRLVLRSAPAMP